MPRRRHCLHEPVLSAHAQIALVEADLPEAVAADLDYALSAAQVRRHAPGPVPLVEGCGEDDVAHRHQIPQEWVDSDPHGQVLALHQAAVCSVIWNHVVDRHWDTYSHQTEREMR